MENTVVMDAAGVSQKTNTIQVKERFLLNSLTSQGYNPMSALDELIDNSIDAEATEITITISKDGITIKDNGCGMTPETLMESINLGSDREYDENNIGYFGSGMNTGIINLIDMDRDGYAVIETNNEYHNTKLKWDITKTPFKYEIDWKESFVHGTEQWGTTITIHNPLKIQPGGYKNHLATYYYPALKDGDLKITVNGDEIIPNDPLYRYEESVHRNYVDAKVGDETIRVEAVMLNENIEKHSWDRGKKGFTYGKAGIYAIYGKRYINVGGMMNIVNTDPWFSRTRVEITIPKKNTKLFKVPQNKVHGFSDLEAPELSELRRKVRDMFAWGTYLRKHNKVEVSQLMKEEQDDLNKKINKIASRAGINKPKTQKEKDEIRKEKKMISFETNPDKVKKQSSPKQKSESVIKQSKTFEFDFDDLGSEFWQIGYNRNVFRIIMNNTHPFYNDIYQRMDKETKLSMMNFMGCLALAQYNTIENDTLCGGDITTFWQEYWYNFSIQIRKMIQNT